MILSLGLILPMFQQRTTQSPVSRPPTRLRMSVLDDAVSWGFIKACKYDGMKPRVYLLRK